MTRYVAVFHPSVIGRVECVRELDDDDEFNPAHVVEPWSGVPAAPTFRAQLELVGGTLAWRDLRSGDEKAAQARAERDRLLDWVDLKRVMPYLEAGEPVPQALRDYKQALRDWPDSPGFPDSDPPVPPQ